MRIRTANKRRKAHLARAARPRWGWHIAYAALWNFPSELRSVRSVGWVPLFLATEDGEFNGNTEGGPEK